MAGNVSFDHLFSVPELPIVDFSPRSFADMAGLDRLNRPLGNLDCRFLLQKWAGKRTKATISTLPSKQLLEGWSFQGISALL